MNDLDTFLFAVPQWGTFIQQWSKGREEIIRMIKRKKWKEMLMEDISRAKLKSSTLGADFHLWDLIGAGELEMFVKITTNRILGRALTKALSFVSKKGNKTSLDLTGITVVVVVQINQWS